MLGKRVGAFRLVSELGSGGLGSVYQAEDRDGATVAVKLVHSGLLAEPGLLKRFLLEAEAACDVMHWNLVRVHGAELLMEEDRLLLVLASQYVEGRTLQDLRGSRRSLDEPLCRHIGREVARALEAIHAAGGRHLKLGPANVLVTEDHLVKLMDYGEAALVRECLRPHRRAEFPEAVARAAPEQLLGRDVDGRADLFSLGVMLYELGTGRHPYEGDPERPRPVTDLNPALSPFFERLCESLLSKDPADRIGSAREVRELLELGERSSWWRQRARGRRAPLHRAASGAGQHGRAKELAELRRLFERARRGQGQVVLIEGVAGLGKRRLVEELVDSLREAGEAPAFARGDYEPGGFPHAGKAFIDAIRGWLGDARMEAAVRQTVGDAPRLASALTALLRGEAGRADLEVLSDEVLRGSLARLLRFVASKGPTVLLIGNLHWAPGAGRALFSSLCRVVPGNRVLLVGTADEELSQAWRTEVLQRECATLLQPGRLPAAEVASLLREMLRSESLSDQLGYRVATRSDGVPLQIVQILDWLRDTGFLVRVEDDTFRKVLSFDRADIPPSLSHLVLARVAGMDSDDRDLVELAACLGTSVDPALLAAAMDDRLQPVLERLGRIEARHGLIRPHGSRYRFCHGEIRQVLYEGLFEQYREHGHAALGEALEVREDAARRPPADLGPELAAELFRHLWRGGRAEHALRYLHAALDACESLQRGEDGLRWAAEVLATEGLVEGAARFEVLMRQGSALLAQGRREEGRGALEEALTLEDDPSLQCRAHLALGLLFLENGRREDAKRHLKQAIDLARRGEDRGTEMEALGAMGALALRLGRFEEARDRLDRAVELARELGDPRREATWMTGLASAHARQGRFDEARRSLEASVESHRLAGDRRGQAEATGELARVLEADGRSAAALRLHEDRLALVREAGDRVGEGNALLRLGSLRILLGDLDGARAALDEARVLLHEAAARREEGRVQHAQGELAAQSGIRYEAKRRYREALAVAGETGDEVGRTRTLVALGRLDLAEGRADSAAEGLEEAAVLAEQLGLPEPLVLASAHLARLQGGDPAVALRTLSAHGASAPQAAVMEARFALWQSTGDPVHLDVAHRQLNFLRDHAPGAFRASILDRVALHREILDAWVRQRG